jgi:hypothetical protein
MDVGQIFDMEQTLACDPKVLARLKQSFRMALERYLELVSQSADHLVRIGPGSVDVLSRVNLLLLKQKEEKAHAAYVRTRAALLAYVLEEGNGSGES